MGKAGKWNVGWVEGAEGGVWGEKGRGVAGRQV